MLLFILFFKYLKFGDIPSGTQKLQEDQTEAVQDAIVLWLVIMLVVKIS